MFEPTDQLADVARLAEEHGFEGIGLADHVVVPEGFRSVHPSGDNPFAPSSSFTDPLTSIEPIRLVMRPTFEPRASRPRSAAVTRSGASAFTSN